MTSKPNIRSSLACLVMALLTLLPASVLACRFNVRDIAFVNLDPNPYRLFVFVNHATPAAFTNALLQHASTTLSDANVVLQLVNLEDNPPGGARTLAEKNGVGSFPGFVLVAPDQRALALKLDSAGLDSAAFARAALESAIASPFRQSVMKRSVASYAQVVILEGDDAAKNLELRRMAGAAVEQIRNSMSRLPKQVKSPPEIVVLSRAEAERERVALWSLELDSVPSGNPAIVVLHGRGRRLGPVLAGPDLREPLLFHFLGVVGQDCECFLDRTWMRGPALPARWDETLQRQATEILGFDPESPLIKSEIGAILAKGPNPNARPSGLIGGTDADLIGYREVSLDAPPDQAVRAEQPGTNAAPADAARQTATPAAGVSTLTLSLIVLAVLSLGAGATLLLRRRND